MKLQQRMKTKVSVIIPVYNTEKYLSKCLDSVCQQTLKEIEIICVNDGSKDNSLCILQEYAASDNRIRIINFEQNKGVSAARNAGIDAAVGEYIGFVDSDDFIDSDFYEELYNMTMNGADIVKGKIQRVGEFDTKRDFADYVDDSGRITNNRGYFFYYFYTAIYSAALLKNKGIRFYEDMVFSEDFCFVAETVLASDSLIVVDNVCYHYVNSDTSVVRNMPNPYNYIRSNILATDRILHSLKSSEAEDSLYKAVYCMVLCCATFTMEFLYHYLGKETEKIQKSMVDYIMQGCKFPEEIYDMYKEYIAKRNVQLRAKQLTYMRKKIQQKQ